MAGSETAPTPSSSKQIRLDIEVAKMHVYEQKVFGWAYTCIEKDGQQVVDYSGDMVELWELEQAAYEFNLYYRGSGEMHKGDDWDTIGTLVESVVFTPEKLKALGIPEGTLPLGWWVGFHIWNAEVFAKIKSGEYKMFSIQGSGTREEVT